MIFLTIIFEFCAKILRLTLIIDFNIADALKVSNYVYFSLRMKLLK